MGTSITLSTWEYIFLGLQVIFYFVAGMSHFIFPKFFYKMMPPFIPRENRRPINLFVGVAETLAAIGLLLEPTRSYAAIGIIILLIGVFPVHVDMLKNPRPPFDLPKWMLWGRIFMQFVLIGLAAMYISF
ncbi:MAG: DoxX family protein [Bacteroidia bacterium]|nr:DoxX family protein [Bacteroidia bacterium]